MRIAQAEPSVGEVGHKIQDCNSGTEAASRKRTCFMFKTGSALARLRMSRLDWLTPHRCQTAFIAHLADSMTTEAGITSVFTAGLEPQVRWVYPQPLPEDVALRRDAIAITEDMIVSALRLDPCKKRAIRAWLIERVTVELAELEREERTRPPSSWMDCCSWAKEHRRDLLDEAVAGVIIPGNGQPREKP
jgi:hypothetical protein